MTSGMYVDIRGIPQIVAALEQIADPKLLRKTLVKASAEGAKIMRAAEKAELGTGHRATAKRKATYVGRGTGSLQGSVQYKAMRRSTTNAVGHVTSAMGRYGSARALVEYGHGGPMPAPAHPFIQPAFDKAEAAALAAMEAALFAALKEF